MFLFAGFCFLFWLTTSTSRKLPTGGSHGDIEEAITKTISNNNKVKVDFYGESLCPDCQHMVLGKLTHLLVGSFPTVLGGGMGVTGRKGGLSGSPSFSFF